MSSMTVLGHSVISVIIKMTLITVCPKTYNSVISVIIKITLITECPKTVMNDILFEIDY